MHIYRLNESIFTWRADHPAKQFLEAFVRCRANCVGRELDGIDQQWHSRLDGCTRTFSSFAYEWLSYDIELDGWMRDAPEITDSEKRALEVIPQIEQLTTECKAAALLEGHSEIVGMCDEILQTLDLWLNCIRCRLQAK